MKTMELGIYSTPVVCPTLKWTLQQIWNFIRGHKQSQSHENVTAILAEEEETSHSEDEKKIVRDTFLYDLNLS